MDNTVVDEKTKDLEREMYPTEIQEIYNADDEKRRTAAIHSNKLRRELYVELDTLDEKYHRERTDHEKKHKDDVDVIHKKLKIIKEKTKSDPLAPLEKYNGPLVIDETCTTVSVGRKKLIKEKLGHILTNKGSAAGFRRELSKSIGYNLNDAESAECNAFAQGLLKNVNIILHRESKSPFYYDNTAGGDWSKGKWPVAKDDATKPKATVTKPDLWKVLTGVIIASHIISPDAKRAALDKKSRERTEIREAKTDEEVDHIDDEVELSEDEEEED
jgi:hypothetical protein